MPPGRPKLPEADKKALTSEAIVVRIHVRNKVGTKTTISMDPGLLAILAEHLGGKAEARAWCKETAARMPLRKGRSLSRSLQTAAVRALAAAPNPL